MAKPTTQDYMELKKDFPDDPFQDAPFSEWEKDERIIDEPGSNSKMQKLLDAIKKLFPGG